MNSKDEAEIVRIAAAIDAHSDHPLAQAVVEYAQQSGVNYLRSQNYQARTGRGAETDSPRLLLGSLTMSLPRLEALNRQ